MALSAWIHFVGSREADTNWAGVQSECYLSPSSTIVHVFVVSPFVDSLVQVIVASSFGFNSRSIDNNFMQNLPHSLSSHILSRLLHLYSKQQRPSEYTECFCEEFIAMWCAHYLYDCSLGSRRCLSLLTGSSLKAFHYCTSLSVLHSIDAPRVLLFRLMIPRIDFRWTYLFQSFLEVYGR